MEYEELMETLEDYECLVCDGLEDALIGYAESCADPMRAVYDRTKCILCFMKDGMTEEEAVEYFEFNTLGAYVGETTPIFVTLLDQGA